MTAQPHAQDVLVVTDQPESWAALRAALAPLSREVILASPVGLPEARVLDAVPVAFVDLSSTAAPVQELRSHGQYVVGLGRPSRSEDVLLALRLGASDFLSADFTPCELSGVFTRAAARQLLRTSWIEYRDELGQERSLGLSAATVTIGRDPSNDLRFDSSVVSRFHAEIRWTGDAHVIVDRGSRHGVHVNSRAVEERRSLNDGDEIRLGGPSAPVLRFRVRQRPAESATTGFAMDMVASCNRELRDIASLLDTFLRLRGDLRLDDLLEIVVERAIDLAQADRGMILLLEPPSPAAREAAGPEPPTAATDAEAQPRLRLAMARNRDGSVIEEEGLLISRRIPESVVQTGHGAILEDLMTPEGRELHPATLEIGVRSAMCVPLKTRRTETGAEAPQVLGVLYVDSTARREPYSPRLLGAFESLASEAAQAISSARLYKVSIEKRRLDEEIRIAHSIQQRILPPSHFQGSWVELYGSTEPSHEVGGDFFGFYPQAGDRIGVAVGDVSGKGVPAAIVSALLDGLSFGLATAVTSAPDLSKIAELTNQYLVKKAGEEKFVSLFFGLIRKDGHLSYVNAGHNPPIRIDAAGQAESLKSGGVILGVFDDAQYASADMLLLPGEVLVLYSDGITEARGAGGERFGVTRLAEAAGKARGLDPRRIHHAVLGSLSEFLGDLRPDDDVTLLVLKYAGSP